MTIIIITDSVSNYRLISIHKISKKIFEFSYLEIVYN
jgi:hypothetical protein